MLTTISIAIGIAIGFVGSLLPAVGSMQLITLASLLPGDRTVTVVSSLGCYWILATVKEVLMPLESGSLEASTTLDNQGIAALLYQIDPGYLIAKLAFNKGLAICLGLLIAWGIGAVITAFQIPGYFLTGIVIALIAINVGLQYIDKIILYLVLLQVWFLLMNLAGVSQAVYATALLLIYLPMSLKSWQTDIGARGLLRPLVMLNPVLLILGGITSLFTPGVNVKAISTGLATTTLSSYITAICGSLFVEGLCLGLVAFHQATTSKALLTIELAGANTSTVLLLLTGLTAGFVMLNNGFLDLFIGSVMSNNGTVAAFKLLNIAFTCLALVILLKGWLLVFLPLTMLLWHFSRGLDPAIKSMIYVGAVLV
jgi:hypothetical protein